MGKDDEIGQVKPIACNISTCHQRFSTVRDMQRHKKNDPNHFYCRRCDVDCEDWEDLTLHKVYAMQPWLEGSRPHFQGDRPEHIVCEFCGADFETFGGRRLHRLKHHQADQDITCPGCKLIFARAGDLLYHLENGYCESISRQRFMGHVQQRIVHEEIWKDPETVQRNLARNQESKELARLPVVADEDQDTDAGGGVDLLGYEEESQNLSIEPLQAEFDLMDVHDRSDAGRSPNRYIERDGGVKIDLEPHPALGSENAVAMKISPTPGSGAWGGGNTSQALFKDAKPTPPAGDWAAILNDRKEAIEVSQGPGLLQCRFWDPTSADWDSTIFYNHLDRRYKCPFQGCETSCYEIESDLIGHLHYAHLSTSYDCPLCGKRFQTGSALISHSEAPAAKCRVKDSKVYGKLLHRVSGGFLQAEHLRLPKVAKGKQLEAGGGLMGMKFTASMPERAEVNG